MRRHAAAGALVALLLAGCAAPAALTPEALRDEPEMAALDIVRTSGYLFSEPALARHPDGTLFLAAYGADEPLQQATRPLLLRSEDGGATWTRLEQGSLAEGRLGNSDTDLAVAPDGTLYQVTMQFLPTGYAIVAGASADKGETWRWRVLAAAPFVDRPWVEVGPDGVAHAIWSSALGLHHASSADGGDTWTEGPLVHPSGGSGGIAVADDGRLAVRVFPMRGPFFAAVLWGFAMVDHAADGVAFSSDGGATWTFRELPGERAWPDRFGNGGDVPRWAEPVVYEADGTLYTAWSEVDVLQLAWTQDHGRTWQVRPLAHAQVDEPMYFPHLARGAAPGELVATWFGGIERPVPYVAHVRDARADAPDVRASAMPFDSPGTRGEYFQPLLLEDGRVAVALPVQGADLASSGFDFVRARLR